MHTYYKIGLAALVLAGLTQSGAFAAFLNYSDLTLSPESYNNGSYSSGYFESNDFFYSYAGGDSGGYPSYASAAAMILFVIVLTITCINLLVSRRQHWT